MRNQILVKTSLMGKLRKVDIQNHKVAVRTHTSAALNG